MPAQSVASGCWHLSVFNNIDLQIYIQSNQWLEICIKLLYNILSKYDTRANFARPIKVQLYCIKYLFTEVAISMQTFFFCSLIWFVHFHWNRSIVSKNWIRAKCVLMLTKKGQIWINFLLKHLSMVIIRVVHGFLSSIQ